MTIFSRAFSVLALCFTCFGCGEKAADLSKTETYSFEGFTFEYPGNWEISEETTFPGGFAMVIVDTPGEGIAIVQFSPDDEFEGLEAYAKDFAADTLGDVPLAEVSSDGFSQMAERHGFERLKEEFTISSLGEGISHGRVYSTKVVDGWRLLLIFQSADEDLSKAAPGFDHILETVKYVGPPFEAEREEEETEPPE